MSLHKVTLSFALAACLAIPSVGFSADPIDLKALAAAQAELIQNEIQEQEAKVEKLKKELEAAKDETAVKVFRRITMTCGGAVAIGVVIAVASSTQTFGKYFGRTGDERLGGVILGGGAAGVAGICAGISGVVYAWINDDVEKLDALVEAAEIELELSKK